LNIDAGECFLLWVTQLRKELIKEKIAAKAKHFLPLLLRILPLYTDELAPAEMPRRPSASPAGVHYDAKKYRSQKHDDPHP